VAAVGKSDRGYLDSITANDLKYAFDINVISSLRLIQCALPGLRKAKGQIAVIASLAGLIARPGMGTYAITKSGQVALARQLRQELSDVGVTLLCCGPIARQDAGSRYSEIAAERSLPEHLHAPGAGVKLKELDPQRLAERLLKAAVARKKELIVPGKAKLLIAISAFFPSLAELILNKLYSKR
jgi:short-subunit dehydrogenase